MQNHPQIVPQRLTEDEEQDCSEVLLQRIARVKNHQLHNYYTSASKNDHDVPYNAEYIFKNLELGFSSVGNFDSNQVSWEAHARELLKVTNNAQFEFLQPGFIFEVVVIDKIKETRELIVVIQRFLAFCDRCHSSAYKHHDADFTSFQKYRHQLEVLIKVNTMNIKGVIDDSEVIEDFSAFNYYISYNKIQIGDHLNAVVLQVDQDQRVINRMYYQLNKPILQMSLKNKCILGGKMWSLVNLSEPKTFSLATPTNFYYNYKGFTKMIGKAFENAAKPENQKKLEEETQINLKFKDEFNVFSFHYQIQNDVFFLNKQNYDLMAKSLKINQFHSLCSKNNLMEIKALNLDYHRSLSKVSAGQAPQAPQPKPVMLQKINVIAKI